MDGRTRQALAARVDSAWRAFWALKHFLFRKRTSVVKRIGLMERAILPRILWGAQCWHLDERDL
eukprot:12461643-Alexandrium_andersonii.AAC.1